MLRKAGIKIVAMGIKNLKVWSKVREIDIQYKPLKKYPKPKNQPYLKKDLLLENVFFVLKIKIKNKENVIKFIIKKLYGGKLNALIAPREIR